MSEYRFRAGEKGELVLQILQHEPYDPFVQRHRQAEWRDATLADVPVFDPFSPPRDNWRTEQAEGMP
jgi:hypothetical protein